MYYDVHTIVSYHSIHLVTPSPSKPKRILPVVYAWRCAEAGISRFIRLGSIGPRCCMCSVGLPSRPPLCRPLSLPICLKRWHKWWFRYNLGLQIKMKRITVPKNMPALSRDIRISLNAFSKRYWLTGNVLLNRELCPQFNQYIRRDGALTNLEPRRPVDEIQIGVTRKMGCFGNPWTLGNPWANRERFEIRVLKHATFLLSATFRPVLDHCAEERIMPDIAAFRGLMHFS